MYHVGGGIMNVYEMLAGTPARNVTWVTYWGWGYGLDPCGSEHGL